MLALNRSATLGQAFNISSISDVSFEGQSVCYESQKYFSVFCLYYFRVWLSL